VVLIIKFQKKSFTIKKVNLKYIKRYLVVLLITMITLNIKKNSIPMQIKGYFWGSINNLIVNLIMDYEN
jgi:hypothetical protein